MNSGRFDQFPIQITFKGAVGKEGETDIFHHFVGLELSDKITTGRSIKGVKITAGETVESLFNGEGGFSGQVMIKKSLFVKIGKMRTDMTVDGITGVLGQIAGVAG